MLQNQVLPRAEANYMAHSESFKFPRRVYCWRTMQNQPQRQWTDKLLPSRVTAQVVVTHGELLVATVSRFSFLLFIDRELAPSQLCQEVCSTLRGGRSQVGNSRAF